MLGEFCYLVLCRAWAFIERFFFFPELNILKLSLTNDLSEKSDHLSSWMRECSWLQSILFRDFFVPMLLTETRSFESHFLEEKKNKHTFDHLLIRLSSQDAEADLLGTYLCMCTFVCLLTEWKMLSVVTASQDELKK